MGLPPQTNFGSGTIVLPGWFQWATDFLYDSSSGENKVFVSKSEYDAFANALKCSHVTGLVVAYNAGIVGFSDGAIVEISTGTITVANNATSWIYVNENGAVANSLTQPSQGILMAQVVASSGVVATVTDKRSRFSLPFPQGGEPPVAPHFNLVVTTQSRTAVAYDLIACDTSGGSVIITAPASPIAGSVFWVWRGGSGNYVDVTSTANINTSASDYRISRKYALAKFVYVSPALGWWVSEQIPVGEGSTTDLGDMPSTLVGSRYLKTNPSGSAYELSQIRSTDLVNMPSQIQPGKVLVGDSLGAGYASGHPFNWRIVGTTAVAQPGDLLVGEIGGTSSYDIFLPGTASGVARGEGVEILADAGTNTGLLRVQPNGWSLNYGTSAVALGGGTYSSSGVFVFEGSTAANWVGSTRTTSASGGGGSPPPTIPNTLAQTISVGYTPTAVLYNSGANKLYIAGGQQVRVYNGSTLALETTINTGLTSVEISTLRFNTATNRLYAGGVASVGASSHIAVIDATNNSVLTTYTVTNNNTYLNHPFFDLDTHNNRNVFFLPFGSTPAYRVYDNSTNTQVATFSFPGAHDISTAIGGIVYVSGSTVKYFFVCASGGYFSPPNTIAEFNGTNFAFVRTKLLSEFSGSVISAPATLMIGGSSLYVTDGASNWIQKYQVSDLSYVGKFATGTTPQWIGRNTSSGKIFVANRGSSNVNIYDSNESLQATVSMANGYYHPDTIFKGAVDNSGNRLFLVDNYYLQLQVFNA